MTKATYSITTTLPMRAKEAVLVSPFALGGLENESKSEMEMMSDGSLLFVSEVLSLGGFRGGLPKQFIGRTDRSWLHGRRVRTGVSCGCDASETGKQGRLGVVMVDAVDACDSSRFRLGKLVTRRGS